MPLLGVLLATGATVALSLEGAGVRVVGAIPAGCRCPGCPTCRSGTSARCCCPRSAWPSSATRTTC
ncbi:hypothetical protein ACFQV2_19700 [Actinokineospora soli]|uniref:Uncharacterized protein n=1 Tax=Actinokineospora soli TaxID=1048753 RepID=A0ABW2TPU4_9PSEU